jgi:hypothetical protein
MSEPAGWQPLSTPRRRAGADAFRLSPFTRLARTHVLTALGDALVTLALAGSLFFDLDPNEARWKVFLYLLLTVAPLAFVAPFIGPALDRSHGGRRWMVVAVNGVRAVVCLVMLDDLNSLLLFPEAFAVLALGKAYGVARSALVPTVVHNDEELVEANSKLQLLSGLAAPGAGLLAAPAYAVAGSQGILGVAVVVYLVGTLAALRIPAAQVAISPPSAAETAELRSIGIVLASTAMALVRGMVGFLTLLLLFGLREDPRWHLGVVAGVTGAGSLIGAAVAPRLREHFSEERMLMVLLGVTVVVGGAAAAFGGLAMSAAMAATIAIVSTGAKLAFDSLVQRDAPDANRGRSFARFEIRFQLAWVIGAVLPLLLLPIPEQVGFAGIAVTAAFALFSYVAGQRAAQRRHDEAPPVDDEVEALERELDLTLPDPMRRDLTAADPVLHPEPVHADLGYGGAFEAGDHAGWQVADPEWGGGPDATRVDQTRADAVDPTRVDPTRVPEDRRRLRRRRR